MDLSSGFWNGRYLNNDTGWDMGGISTPIKEYINQLKNKNISILIPGGGNSYEAEYLHELGFKNVVVDDFSEQALTNINKRIPDFPKANLRQADFFSLTGKFDLIIEQTFFCAIDKSIRRKYAGQISNLLKENGKLVGLLFNAPLNTDKPPFGGNVKEYETYFSSLFNSIVIDNCYNSHPSRAGRELWINISNN
ncbi:MAG: methyltransferase domain-containing protein [Flavobacteriales bacterium]|nr:methyltransferase domain-containing protein [Flavobacteriales bacterium]